MLGLSANGQYLDIPDDFSITINGKSPMFNELGSYSYPFKLKYSQRNAMVLGFMNRPQSTGDPYKTFFGELQWNGITFFSGTLKVTIGNSGAFEGAIYAHEGDFWYSIKNTNLQNVDFGHMVWPNESQALAYINGCNNAFYPTRPVCFPQIFNDNYFDPVSDDPEQQHFNNYRGGYIHNTTLLGNRTVIVPMMYLRYMLDRIFAQLQFSYIDNVFAVDADLSKLAIFNSLSNNTLCPDFDYTLTDIYFNLHVPKVKLDMFLNALCKFFNMHIFIDSTSRTAKLVSFKNILSSKEIIDFSKNIISISVELEDKITGIHLSLTNDDADSAFEDTSTVQDDQLKRYKGELSHVSDLPQFPYAEINDVWMVRDDGYFYTLKPDHTWAQVPVFANNVYSHKMYFNMTEETSIEICSLHSPGFYIGECDCKNKIADYKEITPRMFFTTYGSGLMYASSATPSYGLWFNQYMDPFFKFWKPMADFLMKTAMVKVQRQCDFVSLRDLDFSMKYDINGTLYLIRDYQVTLKKNSISPTLFSLYKL